MNTIFGNISSTDGCFYAVATLTGTLIVLINAQAPVAPAHAGHQSVETSLAQIVARLDDTSTQLGRWGSIDIEQSRPR